MPWKASNLMDERIKFIGRVLDGEKISALCEEFGISRKTGYKIYERYRSCGIEGLSDRSHRAYKQANRLPFQVERSIIGLKKEYAMQITNNRWRMRLADVMVFKEKDCYSDDMKKKVDPVLSRLRLALDKIFGDRLDRVVLYGSRARGDADEYSDYDVAVFLKDFSDRWQEFDKILPVVTEILIDDLADIHALPYGNEAYYNQSPLMEEIRRDGVDL